MARAARAPAAAATAILLALLGLETSSSGAYAASLPTDAAPYQLKSLRDPITSPLVIGRGRIEGLNANSGGEETRCACKKGYLSVPEALE
jgi:hypothetical protein